MFELYFNFFSNSFNLVFTYFHIKIAIMIRLKLSELPRVLRKGSGEVRTTMPSIKSHLLWRETSNVLRTGTDY